MSSFDHRALHLKPRDTVVFTALSKKNFYMRQLVTKFVLDKGCVPLNPFMIFDYFLLDTVDRDVVRQGNNTLIMRSDELWVFGDISDGVQAEIIQFKKTEKPIRYFIFEKDRMIIEIDEQRAALE